MIRNAGNKLCFGAYKILEDNYSRERGLIKLKNEDIGTYIPITSISKAEQQQGNGPAPISIYLKGKEDPLVTEKSLFSPAYYFPNIVTQEKPNET